MRHIQPLFFLIVVTVSDMMGCTAPGDSPEQSDLEGLALRESTLGGFEIWLAQQCPNGAALAIEDVEADEPIRVIPCESLREEVLADPSTRDRLVSAYTTATESPAGEPIGTAREALSPLGALLCGLIATTPDLAFNFGPTGAAACHNPRLSHEEQMRCHNVTAGGSLVLGVLCGLAAVFL